MQKVKKGEIPQNRRGWLKYGNPPGDFSQAPRCGALTRKKTACQQPRMRGKRRCRLHGGKSTGARTAKGLQAIRQGQWVDGRRSRRLQDECLADSIRKGEHLLWPGFKFSVLAICYDGPPQEWGDDDDPNL